MRRTAALLLASSLLSVAALAAPGFLDPTFGTGGFVRPNFGLPTSADFTASVRQPDGKIVVAGDGDRGFGGGSTRALVLARFNADGTADPTFGRGGWNQLVGGGAGNPKARAMAVQADGKIVVLLDSNQSIAFGKVLPDGTRDDSFALNHGILRDFQSDGLEPQALALQADGKYVVAGVRHHSGGTDSFVARYHPNGARDTAFGINGVWTESIGLGEDGAHAVAVDANGRIYFAGRAAESGMPSDAYVARLYGYGSLDWGFGINGVTRIDNDNAEDSASAVSADLAGRVLVAGRTAVGGQGRYLVAKLGETGMLDSFFGFQGMTIIDVPVFAPADGDAAARSILVDELAQVTIAGTVQHLASGDRTFAIVRLQADGMVMSSWGSSGVVVGPLSPSADTLTGLFDQGGDRWVAAGARTDAAFTHSLLAGFVASTGQADPAFGAGGTALHSWRRQSLDTAADFAFAPDGKLVAVGDALAEFGLVARFLPDGSLDATFADNGVIRLAGGLPGAPGAVAVQADSRIVVASESPFGASRFNADGTRDLGWNGGAHTSVPMPIYGYVKSVALQPDGRVVLAGHTWQDRLAIARLNADGSVDTSFNGTGYLVIDRGVLEQIREVAVQPDGRIVAVGGGSGMVALRLLANGALDPSWGGTGIVNYGGTYPSTLTTLSLRPDGRVLVGGSCSYPNGVSDTCIGTLLADGSVDPNAGFWNLHFITQNWESGIPFGIGVDGEKVLVGGEGGPGRQAVAARLLPDGTGDPNYGTSGVGRSGRTGYVARARVQSDGSVVVFSEEFDLGWQLARFEGGGGDNVPDPFDFQDQDGVPLDTMVTSETLTITGLTIPAAISVNGGDYSIGCNGSFTDMAGTISNGQTVCVRHMSGSGIGEFRVTWLTIGGYTGYFATTTGTPPETTIASQPPSLSNVQTATFTFTSNDPAATFECSLDQAAFASCQSPRVYELSDGGHNFRVRAVGPAGADPSPAQYSWVIDSTAPDTLILSGPTGATGSTSATFNFTFVGDGPATYECSLDGAAFAACTNPKEYSGLAEGAHQFRVRAKDGAGNIDATPAVRDWSVDLTGPDTTIVSGPPPVGNSSSVTFTFSASESPATFECKDALASTWISCASPLTLNGIADGTYTFQIRAKDAFGNPDATPASRTFTIDTVVPDTTITAGPSGTVASTAASFAFASNDATATFECRVDGAAYAACTSPVSLSGLGQGAHQFDVRARDAAGNVDASPASRDWSVDTVAPQTSIASGPSGAIASTSASFTFGADDAGATFECSLDGAAFVACTSPAAYSGLGEGAHAFSVRARDALGNTDATPASQTWIVDTVAPTTTITSAPANNTPLPATFQFTSNEPGAAFDCRVDTGAFAPCTSPMVYTTLAKGNHTFSVRARDAAGNVDATPASHTWRVR